MSNKKQRISSLLMYGSKVASYLEPLQGCNITSSLANLPANVKLIGTHDGSFHCDEALAISMLKLLPQYSHNETYVVRSRNPEILAVSLSSTVCYDVILDLEMRCCC